MHLVIEAVQLAAGDSVVEPLGELGRWIRLPVVKWKAQSRLELRGENFTDGQLWKTCEKLKGEKFLLLGGLLVNSWKLGVGEI